MSEFPTPTPDSQHPERPNSNFGVEIQYNPEFLYTLLTRDNKPHNLRLINNWGAISSPNYDVFRVVSLYLHCDLAASIQVDRQDRSTKVFWVEGGLWRTGDRSLPTQEIQEKLLKLGVNTDLITNEKSSSLGKYLVTHSINPNWALDTRRRHRFDADEISYLFWADHLYALDGCGVEISSPKPISDLRSPRDINASLNSAAELIEKTIKASYEVEGKMLPQQNLVFAPAKEETSKQSNRVSCSFCGSDYSIVDGFTCPHCGGSQPHFS